MFNEGAYHVSLVNKQLSSESCPAYGSKNLRNFVYEAQVRIIQGDFGGIIFRVATWKGNYYSFYINSSGQYWLEARINSQTKAILANGVVPTKSATYKLTVIAQDNYLTLYVDQQVVTPRMAISNDLDNDIGSGHIGVIAGYASNTTHPSVETVFTNAKVWEL